MANIAHDRVNRGRQLSDRIDFNPLDDGITVGVTASEDEFNESDDEFDSEVAILPNDQGKKPVVEKIPAEVIESLKSNPDLAQYIGDMVEAQVDARLKARETTAQGSLWKKGKGKRSNELPQVTPQGVKEPHNGNTSFVKSPSDTTIYRPALRQGVSESNEIIHKISNFVENICLGNSRCTTPGEELRYLSEDQTLEQEKVSDKDRGRNRNRSQSPSMTAWAETEKVILDAEHLKAKIQPPKGRQKPFDFDRFLQNMDDDDEFFHVTCHINPTLWAKITRGEFIDLEQLLPKSRSAIGLATQSEENKVELVSSGGHTFFKPVRESQITGLCKWEQAFRVYAAIYTDHNPERSGEIWQYIHIINTPAAAYQWKNVAGYDLTFRQLMLFKPQHSWAKIYNQGWNLAMRDLLGSRNCHGGPSSNAALNSTNNDSSWGRSWRDDCCWKFNKNRCKFAECKFDHRCTYCGG